eukprot:4050771-Pleurochrysis_carterae.AAC.1
MRACSSTRALTSVLLVPVCSRMLLVARMCGATSGYHCGCGFGSWNRHYLININKLSVNSPQSVHLARAVYLWTKASKVRMFLGERLRNQYSSIHDSRVDLERRAVRHECVQSRADAWHDALNTIARQGAKIALPRESAHYARDLAALIVTEWENGDQRNASLYTYFQDILQPQVSRLEEELAQVLSLCFRWFRTCA